MADTAPPVPDIDGLDLDRVRAAVGSKLFGRDEGPPKLGRYTVKSTLGEGAMGRVYLAEDSTLQRQVAVKVILAEDSKSRGRLQERLAREARRLASVAHPNVAAIYDVGVEGDQVYIAMEYIEGDSLRGWLQSKPSRRAILDAFRGAGRGLAAAHAAGLVHRDFKPENVLVGLRGTKIDRVCVVDFGLATPSLDSTDPGSAGAASVHPLTTAAAGTPAYMSPETLTGARADLRSDQYAYCVSLYEALFGERPFDATSPPKLVAEIEAKEPNFDRDAPAWLIAVLRRGLSRDPAARFESMHAVLNALHPPRRRALFPTALAVVISSGLAAGAVLATGPDTQRCEQTAELLAAVWGKDRRRTIEDAFAGSSFGPDTADRVLPRVDAWSQDWVAERNAACRAMLDAGEVERFDRVNACFGRRLDALDAMLRRWEGGTTSVTLDAAAAVDRLPDVEVCTADGSLEDPAVDELRQRVAAAQAGGTEGDLDGAETELLAIVEEARRLGSPEVALEAQLALGNAQGWQGRIDEAESTLEAAFFEAQRIGSDDLAARLAASMAGMKIGPRADPNGADEWVKHAIAALERTPNPDTRLHVRITKAWIEEKRRNYELALAELDAVLQSGAEGKPRIGALERKGHILWDMERFDESEAMAAAALDACRDTHGEKHPECATLVGGVGRHAMRKGDADATEKAFKAAIALVEDAHGPGQLATAPIIANLGVVALARGQYPEAKQKFTTALELFTKHYGPEHERVGGLLQQLAQVEMVLEELETARGHAERALAIEVQLFGPDRLQSARILETIAHIARKDGRPEDALKSGRESIAVLERLGTPHTLHRARANIDIGIALTQLGRGKEAVATLELARDQLEEGHGGPHSDIEYALEALADAYRIAGRPAAAQKATERAKQMEAARKQAAG